MYKLSIKKLAASPGESIIIIISNSYRRSLYWKQQHFLLLVWSRRPETLDFKGLSQYGGCSKKCRLLRSSDPIWNSNSLQVTL